jgi:hypothetical protein
MTEDRTKAHNVSLYPQDWRDVEQVAEKSGVRNVSAALRVILQEWRIIRAQTYHLEAHHAAEQHTPQQNPAPAV